MIKKLREGDRVTFIHASEFGEVDLEGIVIGGEEAVRKMFPIECAEATNCYLIKRKDNFGNTQHFVIEPEDVLGIKDNIHGMEEEEDAENQS